MMDNIFYGLSLPVLLFAIPVIVTTVVALFMSCGNELKDYKQRQFTFLMLPYFAGVTYLCYWWPSTCINSGWLHANSIAMQITDIILRGLACIMCGAVEALIICAVILIGFKAVLFIKHRLELKAINSSDLSDEEKLNKIEGSKAWGQIMLATLAMIMAVGFCEFAGLMAITWCPLFFPFGG